MQADLERQMPLIILGMHRSGTSLTANWIHKCGVNLHPDETSKKSNQRGNYEDWEILKLHNAILEDNQKRWDSVLVPSELQINSTFFERAEKFAENRISLGESWGWKEPRSCLFMQNLWDNIFPEAKILVIYRNYHEVVDSLLRRELRRQSYLRRRNILAKYTHTKVLYPYFRRTLSRKWIRLWIMYNQAILDFIKQLDPSHYIVCSIDQLRSQDQSLFYAIQDKFQIQGLSYYPLKKVFEKELFTAKETIGFSLELKHQKVAEQVLKELQAFSISFDD